MKAKALRSRLKTIGVDPDERRYQNIPHLRKRRILKLDGTHEDVVVERIQTVLHPECGRSMYKEAKRMFA